MKYGENYYQSKSIIGALYRNACFYQNRNIKALNNAFARLGIDDNRLQTPTPMPLSFLVEKEFIFFECFIH
jgi:hypothetical protein